MAKISNAQRIREYLTANPDAYVPDVAKKFNTTKAVVYVIRWQMKNPKPKKAKVKYTPVTPITLVEPKADPVNHPAHYKTGGIETIDFIEAKKLGYNLGNVVKYITRADHKGNRKQDLQKALWYLEREINAA